jgi:hypothetical protein
MPNFVRCRYNIRTWTEGGSGTDTEKLCEAREEALRKTFSKWLKKKCLVLASQLPVKS